MCSVQWLSVFSFILLSKFVVNASAFGKENDTQAIDLNNSDLLNIILNSLGNPESNSTTLKEAIAGIAGANNKKASRTVKITYKKRKRSKVSQNNTKNTKHEINSTGNQSKERHSNTNSSKRIYKIFRSSSGARSKLNLDQNHTSGENSNEYTTDDILNALLKKKSKDKNGVIIQNIEVKLNENSDSIKSEDDKTADHAIRHMTTEKGFKTPVQSVKLEKGGKTATDHKIYSADEYSENTAIKEVNYESEDSNKSKEIFDVVFEKNRGHENANSQKTFKKFRALEGYKTLLEIKDVDTSKPQYAAPKIMPIVEKSIDGLEIKEDTKQRTTVTTKQGIDNRHLQITNEYQVYNESENPSDVEVLLENLCDAAKNNLRLFWELLVKYIKSNGKETGKSKSLDSTNDTLEQILLAYIFSQEKLRRNHKSSKVYKPSNYDKTSSETGKSTRSIEDTKIPAKISEILISKEFGTVAVEPILHSYTTDDTRKGYSSQKTEIISFENKEVLSSENRRDKDEVIHYVQYPVTAATSNIMPVDGNNKYKYLTAQDTIENQIPSLTYQTISRNEGDISNEYDNFKLKENKDLPLISLSKLTQSKKQSVGANGVLVTPLTVNNAKSHELDQGTLGLLIEWLIKNKQPNRKYKNSDEESTSNEILEYKLPTEDILKILYSIKYKINNFDDSEENSRSEANSKESEKSNSDLNISNKKLKHGVKDSNELPEELNEEDIIKYIFKKMTSKSKQTLNERNSLDYMLKWKINVTDLKTSGHKPKPEKGYKGSHTKTLFNLLQNKGLDSEEKVPSGKQANRTFNGETISALNKLYDSISNKNQEADNERLLITVYPSKQSKNNEYVPNNNNNEALKQILLAIRKYGDEVLDEINANKSINFKVDQDVAADVNEILKSKTETNKKAKIERTIKSFTINKQKDTNNEHSLSPNKTDTLEEILLKVSNIRGEDLPENKLDDLVKYLEGSLTDDSDCQSEAYNELLLKVVSFIKKMKTSR